MTRTIQKVWKLQRPLYMTGDYYEIMAYTEGKFQMAFITIDEETMKRLFGDEDKIYVVGTVKRGNLVVDEVIEEQPW